MRISDWSSDVCSSDLVWALADPEGSQSLKQIAPGMALLGFSTDLGIAVVSSCENFFSRIDEPIQLIITSPPYPLAKPRRYGTVTEAQYADWLCKTLDTVIKLLVPGGNIRIKVGNDVFMRNSTALSLYCERLILAIHARI